MIFGIFLFKNRSWPKSQPDMILQTPSHRQQQSHLQYGHQPSGSCRPSRQQAGDGDRPSTTASRQHKPGKFSASSFYRECDTKSRMLVENIEKRNNKSKKKKIHLESYVLLYAFLLSIKMQYLMGKRGQTSDSRVGEKNITLNAFADA